MSPESFQKELRRRLGATLELRQDRLWALRHGKHRDSWQVWDRGVRTNEPYHVFTIERGGKPAPFGEWVFAKICPMRSEVVHAGRQSWSELVGLKVRDAQRARQERSDQRMRERMIANHDPIRRMFGHGKVFALNGSMVPR